MVLFTDVTCSFLRLFHCGGISGSLLSLVTIGNRLLFLKSSCLVLVVTIRLLLASCCNKQAAANWKRTPISDGRKSWWGENCPPSLSSCCCLSSDDTSYWRRIASSSVSKSLVILSSQSCKSSHHFWIQVPVPAGTIQEDEHHTIRKEEGGGEKETSMDVVRITEWFVLITVPFYDSSGFLMIIICSLTPSVRMYTTLHSRQYNVWMWLRKVWYGTYFVVLEKACFSLFATN